MNNAATHATTMNTAPQDGSRSPSPLVRVDYARTMPDGTTEAEWPDGLKFPRWIARSAMTLALTRPDPSFARVWASPIHRDDLEPSCLSRAASQLREFALACRQARYEGGALPSAAGLYGACFMDAVYALIWVERHGAEGCGVAELQALNDETRVLSTLIARQANVPPPVERVLASEGAATVDLVVWVAEAWLRALTSTFKQAGGGGTVVRDAVRSAESSLFDLQAIVQEGLNFAAGLLPIAPPLPAVPLASAAH